MNVQTNTVSVSVAESLSPPVKKEHGQEIQQKDSAPNNKL
jgi:hypothetical protein